jgi:hypothetical protein
MSLVYKLNLLTSAWEDFNIRENNVIESVMPDALQKLSITAQLCEIARCTFYTQDKAVWRRLADAFINDNFMLLCEILHEIPEDTLAKLAKLGKFMSVPDTAGVRLVYGILTMDAGCVPEALTGVREELRTLWRIFVMQHAKQIEPFYDVSMEKLTSGDTILDIPGFNIRIPSDRMNIIRDMFNRLHQTRVLTSAYTHGDMLTERQVIAMRELGELFVSKYAKDINRIAREFHTRLCT